MKCPFGPCQWDGEPIEQQARFGEPETNRVIPIHDVRGEASWFGRCPGSMLIVPAITPAGMSVLGAAMKAYLKRKIEREREAKRREEATAAAEWERKFPGRGRDEGLLDYYARVGPPDSDGEPGIVDMLRTHGPHIDPRVAAEDYFPGRPADAPEPGPGDPPAPLPPAAKDALIINLDEYLPPKTNPGRATVSDSARGSLATMIATVINRLEDVQRDLTGMMSTVDRLLAVRGSMEHNIEAAASLARAAIGSDASAPENATSMLSFISLTSVVITGAADESIEGSLQALSDSTRAALQRCGKALTEARAYLETI